MDAVQKSVAKVPEWFPPGTGIGEVSVKTRAKPEIWQQKDKFLADQKTVQGQLATRLEVLGAALATFAGAMADDWRNTVVIVISEFGRTFRENGNRGTDHGHGTVYWVLGGALSGGRVAGEQVRVARGTLFQDRDYPVLNDYRALLGGLFGRIYGLKAEALARVFPGATPQDLALV